MVIANLICYCLVLLGALNWALVGIFNWNFVAAIFGGTRAVGSIIIYCIIFAAALWLIISPIITNGKLYLRHHERNSVNTESQAYTSNK